MDYWYNGSHNLTVLHITETNVLGKKVTEILNLLNYVVLGGCIATFGITTNIINIIIFLKQGFIDSVNVSLFALTLSDLSSLIILLWISLLLNPLIFNSDVPLLPLDVLHLTGGWPHGFFARTTSWITAYITLERCLCVIIPLRVKAVATPKLAVSVLTSVFLVHLLTLIPDYSTCYLDWRLDPEHNKTVLGLLFKEGFDEMAVLSFTLAAYTQIISFLAVVLFTIILVIKMKQKSSWRATTANVGGNSQKRNQKRDTKTVQMVILIAGIYCACYAPTMSTYLTTSIEPQFFFMGTYKDAFLVSWSFAFVVDSINSSVNIFVYYRMSSKYRATFNELLPLRKC